MSLITGCGGGDDPAGDLREAVAEVDEGSADDPQLVAEFRRWCDGEVDPADVYVFDLLAEDVAAGLCDEF